MRVPRAFNVRGVNRILAKTADWARPGQIAPLNRTNVDHSAPDQYR